MAFSEYLNFRSRIFLFLLVVVILRAQAQVKLKLRRTIYQQYQNSSEIAKAKKKRNMYYKGGAPSKNLWGVGQ
mgnify:CR=1 FL=1